MLVVPIPESGAQAPLKVYPEWKALQKILWAEVRKKTGKGKDRWNIWDLLADESCGRTVLDFLSTTDVVRRVQAEEDAVSEASEAELGGLHCSSPHPTSWRLREPFRGVDSAFHSSSPLSSRSLSFLLKFRWCASHLGTGLSGGQRGTCNVPPLRGHRTGNGLYIISP